MEKDILTFVTKCDSCQQQKCGIVKTLGALQPLPIPPTLKEDILMDFIMSLPKAGNKSVIIMVVDRLSKYAHFRAIQHPFTLANVAQILSEHIFKI